MKDAAASINFAADMQALVTSDMAAQTVSEILEADPNTLNWEIGEAFAECILAESDDATWPWHEGRDLKTPKASLPGADIVGFVGDNQDACFLFGEVKTSSDISTPPGVLSGRSGLIHQVDTLANNARIKSCLVKYLYHRCVNTGFWPKYQAAVKRYLASGGKDIMIVGVLLRDTPHNILDLQSRGMALAASLNAPLRFRLDAWYLPRPCAEWPAILNATGAS
ncbi:hypothetical protein [Nitrospirillum amazonense]|uniref:hypothetical protein n=1 Tax=Nitrospirillum amazonense TaxID=28077 RepID=UPI002412CDFF|nr:hypothetical protein [Nitrospirillum amazonense]MDG3440150.1 hypothetical protein [Nitrospirillum amazonense]